MQVSEFTIRILLLFFPGIICSLIVDSLTVHRTRSTFGFMIYSFVFGVGSYLLFYCEKYVANHIPYVGSFVDSRVVFLDALMNESIDPQFMELAATTFFSAIPLALLLSGFSNRRYLHRFARFVGVTRKINDLDVWDYTFDLADVQWVDLRDIRNDLVFRGRVAAFSDSADENELLLTNVTVFRNSTGHELYRVDALYLARERNELTIEFPRIDSKKSSQIQ